MCVMLHAATGYLRNGELKLLRIYFDIFCRSLLFPLAFLFIPSFVAHFIIFLLHEILAGFLSSKGRNLMRKK